MLWFNLSGTCERWLKNANRYVERSEELRTVEGGVHISGPQLFLDFPTDLRFSHRFSHPFCYKVGLYEIWDKFHHLQTA